MLLLPMTTRVNFCDMKFSSLVVLEQLNMPKPFGPRARALSNPAAARCSASSQVAGRSLPPSLMSGCVRRSRPSSTQKEYRGANSGGPANPRSSSAPHDHPFGGDETELPTDQAHLPSTFMHEPMVEEAEQDQVGQVAR